MRITAEDVWLLKFPPMKMRVQSGTKVMVHPNAIKKSPLILFHPVARSTRIVVKLSVFELFSKIVFETTEKK